MNLVIRLFAITAMITIMLLNHSKVHAKLPTRHEAYVCRQKFKTCRKSEDIKVCRKLKVACRKKESHMVTENGVVKNCKELYIKRAQDDNKTKMNYGMRAGDAMATATAGGVLTGVALLFGLIGTTAAMGLGIPALSVLAVAGLINGISWLPTRSQKALYYAQYEDVNPQLTFRARGRLHRRIFKKFGNVTREEIAAIVEQGLDSNEFCKNYPRLASMPSIHRHIKTSLKGRKDNERESNIEEQFGNPTPNSNNSKNSLQVVPQ